MKIVSEDMQFTVIADGKVLHSHVVTRYLKVGFQPYVWCDKNESTDQQRLESLKSTRKILFVNC